MIKHGVNNISEINRKNNFLVYPSNNTDSSSNIFFVGSCRTVPLMYYLHILLPEYNIYSIYVPDWTNQSGADKDRIQLILNHSDYVITETVRSRGIFNTDHDLHNNFFQTFHINAKEIRICNLELHMYHHDLHNVFKIKDSEKYDWFIRSKERLQKSLESKKQNFIWHFIEDNLSKIRLFATQNHPMTILSIASFIFIAQQMNIKLDLDFLLQIRDHHFLDGHFTPILPIDIETYNFEFPCAVFPGDTINQINYRYAAPNSEKIISLETLNNLLLYSNSI